MAVPAIHQSKQRKKVRKEKKREKVQCEIIKGRDIGDQGYFALLYVTSDRMTCLGFA